MKTSTCKYFFLLGLGGFIIACSTKKDTFINRNYHALTTKDNVLYNGKNALAAGLNDLKTTYADNYWDVLPIERMQLTAEEMAPTDQKNANFERAEQKATKAIQKHSMYIDGTEHNPQIDEAHMLLGKARYYDNRFIPALEAFNYILYKYPGSSEIDEAKIWRAKTNIRLENEAVAIKNLNQLLKEKKDVMDEQVYSDANAMLAQGYVITEKMDSAVYALNEAVKFTKDHEQQARYRFILGQLYSKLNMPDSAYASFQSVIDMKRKSPRIYVIQAHAQQAAQFDFKNGDTLAFMEKYRDLLEDRENRPYLDIINHQVALFYDKQGMDDKAIEYYNKSLRKKGKDRYLAASNHRNIAEIYFEDAQYATAGKYYDSTMVFMDTRTREYRSIKKKRDNLQDVIKYEGIARVNDSILHVVSLTKQGQEEYYNAYIEDLKKKEEELRKKMEEEARRQENAASNSMFADDNAAPSMAALKNGTMSKIGGTRDAMGTITPAGTVANTATAGNTGAIGANSGPFYFYNTATVSYGKLEFKKRWGNRPLADNWRWSAELTSKGNAVNADDTVAGTDDADGNTKTDAAEDVVDPRYTPEYYIAQLPTEQKVLDSLATERNFAYYQLGVIYKEKFKEYQRAADKLEGLLKNNPEERLVLPSQYNLYKIYQIIDPAKAEKYKQQILTQYPDSRYAEIIRNPGSEESKRGTPEAVYASFYKQYQEEDPRVAAIKVDELIDTYTGEEIVSKYELLKAKIAARLRGLEEYKKQLNYVALNYPTSQEGKEAEETLNKDIPVLEKLAFGRNATSWKLVFKFDEGDPKIEPLKEKIKQYIKDGLNNNIILTQDVYTEGEDFLVIHGFISKLAAEDAISILKDYKEYKITETPVIISGEDYSVVQIKKNYIQYLAIQ
ncbi:type IX secretion system periplasmic lipoprotein PorW/SprE [Flavobacterium rhizosphaerae]|uniref:Tetratricopeptide repeat protein n=1 Tax=Flavobacterium rhizosphaerae TaxID=3163298 RepID=A0ABW8YY46_9FLAO